MKITDLKNKKILILGFGKEGHDTYLFIRKLWPNKVVGIADKQESSKLKTQISRLKLKTQNFRLYGGKNYLNSLKNYDAIIKSPGIPFKILPKTALKKVITQTDIFFQNCPGTIIGVTGTKGKSTTTAMIYKILREGNIKAHLIGNIGKPVLSFLEKAKKDDIFVYELSSHQLYNLKKSPHIAVFLNIYPEHLDYYKNFKEYAAAKANITLHQTKNDYLIYNPKDKLVSQIAKKSKAQKIPIPTNCEYLTNVRIKNTVPFANIMAAAAVGKLFKIPAPQIIKAIKNFKPLPHRLELVGTYRGITFYDDAIATIPEATIAAINKLGDRVETIFLGGFDRNIEFNSLAKKVLNSKIKNTILFPTTGEKIWKTIQLAASAEGKKLPKAFFTDNMKDAVKIAYKETARGKICLLSCASSSFSIFKDYNEKGNLFKKFIKLLGNQ